MAQRALTPGNAAYCSECGAETQPDAGACARCEQPFTGSMQAVFCPICNSINPVEAAECVNCNAKFPEPGTIGTSAPLSPADGSPEEEYLRRILQLEEGLVNMENTYRNILRLQQDELKARETSLRGRIDAFRRELESREKAFGQLKERESDIVRKEDEFRSVMNRVHERQREIEKREELLRDKGRLLDELHHALSGAEVDLERKRWELEQKASGGRPATKEESTITIRSDSEIGELKSRMVQLEEQMERLMEERNKLVEQQKELLRLRDELKVVMKDVDDLLGDLPPDKIRTFAKSKKFALYEKILERLEL